jgi:CheY-specific phosphatase CheX
MKIEYVSNIIKNTKDAFNEMVKMSVDGQKPMVIDKEKNNEYNISVKIEGDLKGSIILTSNKDTALTVAKSFIKEGSVEDNDIKEVLGELTNKIADSTKKTIKNKKIQISKKSFSKDTAPFEQEVSYVEIPFDTHQNKTFSIIAGLEENDNII